MTNYDPPADPYGDEKRCRICDQPMTWNWIAQEWECDHVPPLVKFFIEHINDEGEMI